MKYCVAIKDDLKPLVNIATEFEIDKLVAFEKVNDFDRKKTMKENQRNIKTYLADDTYHYILCKEKDNIIAYIFLSYDNKDGFINEVYVDPNYRKKGIAKNLLNKGIIWLKKNKCTTIDITVHKKNKPAMALYKSFGFDKYNDSYFPMRKTL